MTHFSGGFLERDHDHRHCVLEALDGAAVLCAERGARLTELRRRVLELIWSGHRPLGAYDVLGRLGRERGGAAPPTVYRALDFLLEHGLIHRIESLKSFVGCAHPGIPHAGQFLICRDCGRAAEINEARIDDAIALGARRAGFRVESRTIEVEGSCPHCQGKGSDGNGRPR